MLLFMSARIIETDKNQYFTFFFRSQTIHRLLLPILWFVNFPKDMNRPKTAIIISSIDDRTLRSRRSDQFDYGRMKWWWILRKRENREKKIHEKSHIMFISNWKWFHCANRKIKMETNDKQNRDGKIVRKSSKTY